MYIICSLYAMYKFKDTFLMNNLIDEKMKLYTLNSANECTFKIKKRYHKT